MCCSSLYDLAESWNVWDICVVPHSAEQTLPFENPLFPLLSSTWMLEWPQNWADLLATGGKVSAEACFGTAEVFLLASPK